MTEVVSQGQVGPQILADGTVAPGRLGRAGERISGDLHGRFYEANYRSALYSVGMGMTSISNATYTTGTLTNAVTGIVGLWNPATSTAFGRVGARLRGSAAVSEARVDGAVARDRRMAQLIRRELHELALELGLERQPEPEPPPQPRVWVDAILGTTVAGASFTYPVSGADLYPLSVMCRLTTSGVAGDRSLALEYQLASGQRYCVAGANVTVAASQQQGFCWHPAAGVGSWPVEDVAVAPLPQQTLPNGRLLVIRLANGDAADQLDQIVVSARLSIRPGLTTAGTELDNGGGVW